MQKYDMELPGPGSRDLCIPVSRHWGLRLGLGLVLVLGLGWLVTLTGPLKTKKEAIAGRSKAASEKNENKSEAEIKIRRTRQKMASQQRFKGKHSNSSSSPMAKNRTFGQLDSGCWILDAGHWTLSIGNGFWLIRDAPHAVKNVLTWPNAPTPFLLFWSILFIFKLSIIYNRFKLIYFI